jgi:gliding motility-associated-like protein
MGVNRPTATVNLITSSTSICSNDVVFFEATLTDCPDNSSYSWSINGQIVAVTDSNVFSTSALIDGDILTVENSCFINCLEFITINSPPMSVYSFDVEAGADQSATPGAPVSVSGVTNAPIHVWEPTFLFSNPLALNTLFFPEETTTITLTATENGCTLSDYLTVTVSEELLIPRMFSPNGDNINDLWVISGIDKYPDNSIYIYDRWGQEVFQSRSYSLIKAWDGKVMSKTVSEGVFYYVLELNDVNKQKYKGSITVIR